ncbi:MAG: hypothetical protein QM770_06025 [Tepidisphaeraceae bacterium]
MFTSGSASFNGGVTRDDAKQVTTVTLNVPQTQNLQFGRGNKQFALNKPVTAKFMADISTDLSKPSVKEQLREVIVKALTVDVPNVVVVGMPTPIKLTGLAGGKPDASGQVTVNAQLGALGILVQTLTGGSNPIGVAGELNATQTVGTTSGNVVSLAGNADATNLKPIAPDAKPLPDTLRKLSIANEVVLDLGNGVATAKKLELSFPDEPQTLRLSFAGKVSELMKQNTLDGVSLRVQYDLARLVALSRAALPKETVESMGDLAAEGKGDETWKLEGSYPMIDAAGTPMAFQQSVRSLRGSGRLQIDRLLYKGAEITKLDAPFTLSDGQVVLAYADKTGKDRFPPAANINGGKLYHGGMVIDLKTTSPTLSIAKDQPLVQDMQLTDVLAAQLGKYVSVLFSNTEKASGVVSITSKQFDSVPLNIASARGTQIGQLTIDVKDLYLDGYMPKLLSSTLDLGTQGLRGKIGGSSVRFANGTTQSDVTVTIIRRERVQDKKGKWQDVEQELPLRFAGTIDLQSMMLSNTNLEFATALIKSPEIQKVLGEKAALPIKGALSKPQIDFAGFVQDALKRGLLNGALGGDNGDKQVGDLIGGLLGGKKKQDEPKK